ncbi:MAG: P-loop NTPase [Phycisphaerae bacterium]|nr:P-loop NTPase [Phycisphaerae bacterium]
MAPDFEYSTVAIDHAQNPRNVGALASYDGHARVTGPCGDTMEFWLQVHAGRIRRASFTTDGCGSSLACGSMAAELAMGKTLEQVLGIRQKDVLDALGGLPEEVQHCALLATNTLHAACEEFISNGRPEQTEQSAQSGSCKSCDSGSCSAKARRQDESEQEFAERQELERRLCRIRHKLLVLSGKGGVGKSTVAANLAVSLAQSGNKVGLLDIDVHGPSIPKLLGLDGRHVVGSDDGMLPVKMNDNLAVMSIGFMVGDERTPVIWRGPMKYGVIRQFLKDVAWGELDYLVVDSPPGTGDEPLSVAQLIGPGAGAVIVTTPQEVAIADVRRCVSFCGSVSLPVIGIVENMSGYVCPKCGERVDLFKTGGGKALAEEMNVPFLGTIPIDPHIVTSGDAGRPFVDVQGQTSAGQAFSSIVQSILAQWGLEHVTIETKNKGKENHPMKIAVPVADGRLAAHFGHCEEFAILEADQQGKEIVSQSMHASPPHEPGLLPRWLHELGADVIIAGGMGQRAQQLFAQNGITVVVGAPAETPEQLASAYLSGTLQPGENICDH